LDESSVLVPIKKIKPPLHVFGSNAGTRPSANNDASHPMAPVRNWAQLPMDMVTCIADHIPDPASYRSARGVCKEWRSLLQPEPPTLIVAGVRPAAAASSRRPFRLMTRPEGSKCVGADHGWVAIAYSKPKPAQWERRLYNYRNFEEVEMNGRRVQLASLEDPATKKSFLALFNPATGRRIHLPEHDRLDPSTAVKVVFAPHPRPDDYTVVVAFGWNYLAYISTRDGGVWSFSEIPCGGNRHLGLVIVTDMVYRESGGGDRVYCLTRRGDVHVLHVPRGRSTKAAIEPLLVPELAGHPFNPAAVFPPQYVELSDWFDRGKKLVLCGGELYQVWRNIIGIPFNKKLPGGGFLPVGGDEVFVFRYDPSCRPCWKVAGDLEGHAVFVGPANSAASVRAEDVPGLKGDCVYWIGEPGYRDTGAFDMRTKTSTPCVPPSAFYRGVPICWYSLWRRR
jgi:hypothetical protein